MRGKGNRREKLSRQEDPSISEDQLTLVVKKIHQITRESTLDYAIRIGSLVVHYFYDGDTRLWRTRGPKTQSFRRLASHPQLPMSPSTLYRCVAVFELCDRLDVVEKWSHLTVSHLRIILRLDESDQRRLLSAANAERWSVERLEREVRQIASPSTAHGGRLPASELVRMTRTIDRMLHSGSLVLGGLADFERMLGERYADVEQRLRQSIRGLEEARDAMLARGDHAPARLRDAGPVRAVETADDDERLDDEFERLASAPNLVAR